MPYDGGFSLGFSSGFQHWQDAVRITLESAATAATIVTAPPAVDVFGKVVLPPEPRRFVQATQTTSGIKIIPA